jgi:hypothetical protein
MPVGAGDERQSALRRQQSHGACTVVPRTGLSQTDDALMQLRVFCLRLGIPMCPRRWCHCPILGLEEVRNAPANVAKDCGNYQPNEQREDEKGTSPNGDPNPN